MSDPQVGIFVEGSAHQHHLEYRLRRGVSTSALMKGLRQACEVDARGEGGELPVVVGVSKPLWASHCEGAGQPDFENFEALFGPDGWHAPSTQADLWIWVQGDARDAVFDRALAVDQCLRSVCELVVDVPVFVRAENRDLTGFVDGSANPKDDVRYAAAVIAAGQKGEGGSIAFTQRWVHDLPAFGARSVTEQERIIGRTKPDSIELEGDAMPADSHVAKTDLSEDGVALKIYRRSSPYGSVGEHGLHFVCFATTQRRIQLQLESMFGLSADGEHDRIIEYSTPVTGSYWFVPSTQMLTAALASL